MLPVNNVIQIVRGRYTREQIEIVHRETRGVRTTAFQQNEIDRIWRLRKAENPTIFDGLQVRLDSCEETDSKLVLNTSVTSYREFVGTNLNHPEWLTVFGEDFLSNPIGVSGTIKTVDDFLIFGVRGSKVAEYSGCVDTIGGNLSPSLHLTEEKIDPFEAFISEICEELTVNESQINSVVATGLWKNAQTLRPELVFRATLSIRSSAVRAVGSEHSELIFVPSVGLSNFIELHRQEITPSCTAALVDLLE